MFFLSQKQKVKQTNWGENQDIKILNNNNNKSTQGTHGVCFVLADYFWTWGGLSWGVVDVPSDTPLDKMGFLFPSRYQ